jgi:hypothetical protein
MYRWSIVGQAKTAKTKRGAWSLGRRSLVRCEEQLYRDPGRTPFASRDVGEGDQQGHPDGHLRAHQAGKKLPSELYKSLTWDRGKELRDHRRFTLATNTDVYFCDPQSPWQRGSNENTTVC